MKKNEMEFAFFCLMYLNWKKQKQYEIDFRNGKIVPGELKMDIFKDSGIFFGRMKNGELYVGKPAYIDGHVLIVGFPGSGKTMAIVIPTMMSWRGIQIIIDVKGILYSYWEKLNMHTGKKIKLIRLGATNDNCCRYDPFAFLRHGGADNLSGNARNLVLDIMPLLPTVREPVWIQTAQNFLTGAIIYYFDLGCSFNETMIAVQSKSISETIDLIMDAKNENAKIYMSKLSDVDRKVIGNIGMELSKLAPLVNDPAIRDIFSLDDDHDLLDWQELNMVAEPFDVILVFPEAYLDRCEPMILLIINQLIRSLEQRHERTYSRESELPPVLVMLDEFPRLGKISAIQNGLATLRSRGVTFALFVQSLTNLNETYGSEAAKVIIDICQYKVIMGVSDPISQEYFSKAVGTIESEQRGISANLDPFSRMFTGFGMNISETREPIIYPHEFLTLTDVVVVNPHNGFCRVNKVMVYEHEDTFFKPQLFQNQDTGGSIFMLTQTTCEGGNYYG